MSEILSELKDIISDCIKIRGLDLVEFIYRYEGRNLFLRILVDKPQGGITIDECAELNNEIGRILDEKDILQQKYILEVSSPGLDRPLSSRSDFLRCINRRVRFCLAQPINGKLEIKGVIIKVEDDNVHIDNNGIVMQIHLSQIVNAKQIIDNF